MSLDLYQDNQGRFSAPGLRNWIANVRKNEEKMHLLLQGKSKMESILNNYNPD